MLVALSPLGGVSSEPSTIAHAHAPARAHAQASGVTAFDLIIGPDRTISHANEITARNAISGWKFRIAHYRIHSVV